MRSHKIPAFINIEIFKNRGQVHIAQDGPFQPFLRVQFHGMKYIHVVSNHLHHHLQTFSSSKLKQYTLNMTPPSSLRAWQQHSACHLHECD